MNSSSSYDMVVIGAGIVGLASALQILRQKPGLKLAILDKESKVAQHQTGHNSGVIHSGIYYEPGGSKAINCIRGYRLLVDFCVENGVPYDLCGKVIVATKESERPQIEKIFQRGQKNGLKGIRRISGEEVREKEPYVQALEGIWVPEAGIVDYSVVANKYAERITQLGGVLLFGYELLGVKEDGNTLQLETNQGVLTTGSLINCAGLYADKIAAMTGLHTDVQIIPFRGEYYTLSKEKEHYVNNLIYPVPDPNFPFLGVHYTRMMRGGIEAGPNAVLAFKREGYSRWDFNWKELTETLAYPGFRTLAGKHWKKGMGELYRSYSKRAFVQALQHLIPEIGMDDLHRGNAGVRAQAINPKGGLVDDFLILENARVVNVCNAPSPAATSSLAIGEMVASKALTKVDA
ncbi:MAG: L-2-hydroxyglutarate oxidase [Saprospiraceae bacterium]|nr:L-2-hydroxyglutarate oxidase [Saprospiraceae bacterium]